MAYSKNPVNPKAPSNNASWTKKDDAILKEMASGKSTTDQIAVALGRTKASVWGRKSNLGVKDRLASSKGQKKYLYDLLNDAGYSKSVLYRRFTTYKRY